MRFLQRIWTYRRIERPYMFLGVLCLLAGAGGLLDPEAIGHTVIANQLSEIAQRLWLGCYALGGAAILIGTTWPRRPRPEFETFGLCAVLGGMGVNAVVVLSLRGFVGGGTTLLSILFASWMVQGRLLELQQHESWWDRRLRERRR